MSTTSSEPNLLEAPVSKGRLAHFQGAPRNLFNSIVAIVTHIICVGLPISIVVSRSAQAVTNAKVMNRR
jgi:hypothetical protein